jgi:hypothetical protein
MMGSTTFSQDSDGNYAFGYKPNQASTQRTVKKDSTYRKGSRYVYKTGNVKKKR